MPFERRTCPGCGVEYMQEFVASVFGYRFGAHPDRRTDDELPFCPRCGEPIDAAADPCEECDGDGFIIVYETTTDPILTCPECNGVGYSG